MTNEPTPEQADVGLLAALRGVAHATEAEGQKPLEGAAVLFLDVFAALCPPALLEQFDIVPLLVGLEQQLRADPELDRDYADAAGTVCAMIMDERRALAALN